MDRTNLMKLKDFWKKYQYAMLILLIGIVLMLYPGPGKRPAEVPAKQPESKTPDLETRLSELLSHMEGAGTVKVLLTEAEGEELCYQTNDQIGSSGGTVSERRDTVILTDASRAQNALVRQISPPKYLGAVVLCSGADSAAVRLAIIDAVSNAAGLNRSKITVLKLH